MEDLEDTQLLEVNNNPSSEDSNRVLGVLHCNNQKHEIRVGVTTIGRHNRRSIVLNDGTVSKRHATIECHNSNEDIFIFDEGSANRTRLRQTYLTPFIRYQLTGGSTICFGNVQCTFLTASSVLDQNEDEENSVMDDQPPTPPRSVSSENESHGEEAHAVQNVRKNPSEAEPNEATSAGAVGISSDNAPPQIPTTSASVVLQKLIPSRSESSTIFDAETERPSLDGSLEPLNMTELFLQPTQMGARNVTPHHLVKAVVGQTSSSPLFDMETQRPSLNDSSRIFDEPTQFFTNGATLDNSLSPDRISNNIFEMETQCPVMSLNDSSRIFDEPTQIVTNGATLDNSLSPDRISNNIFEMETQCPLEINSEICTSRVVEQPTQLWGATFTTPGSKTKRSLLQDLSNIEAPNSFTATNNIDESIFDQVTQPFPIESGSDSSESPEGNLTRGDNAAVTNFFNEDNEIFMSLPLPEKTIEVISNETHTTINDTDNVDATVVVEDEAEAEALSTTINIDDEPNLNTSHFIPESADSDGTVEYDLEEVLESQNAITSTPENNVGPGYSNMRDVQGGAISRILNEEDIPTPDFPSCDSPHQTNNDRARQWAETSTAASVENNSFESNPAAGLFFNSDFSADSSASARNIRIETTVGTTNRIDSGMQVQQMNPQLETFLADEFDRDIFLVDSPPMNVAIEDDVVSPRPLRESFSGVLSSCRRDSQASLSQSKEHAVGAPSVCKPSSQIKSNGVVGGGLNHSVCPVEYDDDETQDLAIAPEIAQVVNNGLKKAVVADASQCTTSKSASISALNRSVSPLECHDDETQDSVVAPGIITGVNNENEEVFGASASQCTTSNSAATLNVGAELAIVHSPPVSMDITENQPLSLSPGRSVLSVARALPQSLQNPHSSEEDIHTEVFLLDSPSMERKITEDDIPTQRLPSQRFSQPIPGSNQMRLLPVSNTLIESKIRDDIAFRSGHISRDLPPISTLPSRNVQDPPLNIDTIATQLFPTPAERKISEDDIPTQLLPTSTAHNQPSVSPIRNLPSSSSLSSRSVQELPPNIDDIATQLFPTQEIKSEDNIPTQILPRSELRNPIAIKVEPADGSRSRNDGPPSMRIEPSLPKRRRLPEEESNVPDTSSAKNNAAPGAPLQPGSTSQRSLPGTSGTGVMKNVGNNAVPRFASQSISVRAIGPPSSSHSSDSERYLKITRPLVYAPVETQSYLRGDAMPEVTAPVNLSQISSYSADTQPDVKFVETPNVFTSVDTQVCSLSPPYNYRIRSPSPCDDWMYFGAANLSPVQHSDDNVPLSLEMPSTQDFCKDVEDAELDNVSTEPQTVVNSQTTKRRIPVEPVASDDIPCSQRKRTRTDFCSEDEIRPSMPPVLGETGSNLQRRTRSTIGPTGHSQTPGCSYWASQDATRPTKSVQSNTIDLISSQQRSHLSSHGQYSLDTDSGSAPKPKPKDDSENQRDSSDFWSLDDLERRPPTSAFTQQSILIEADTRSKINTASVVWNDNFDEPVTPSKRAQSSSQSQHLNKPFRSSQNSNSWGTGSGRNKAPLAKLSFGTKSESFTSKDPVTEKHTRSNNPVLINSTVDDSESSDSNWPFRRISKTPLPLQREKTKHVSESSASDTSSDVDEINESFTTKCRSGTPSISQSSSSMSVRHFPAPPRPRSAARTRKTRVIRSDSESDGEEVSENFVAPRDQYTEDSFPLSCVAVRTRSSLRPLQIKIEPVLSQNSLTDADSSRGSGPLKPTVRKQRTMNVALTGSLPGSVLVSLRELGGRETGIDIAAVLVCDSVKKTVKLLGAAARGIPVVSTKWVEASRSAGEWLDAWQFILKDEEAERRWGFSLKLTLEKARNAPLFNGFHICASKNTSPPPHEILHIATLAGALVINDPPVVWPPKSILITKRMDQPLWPPRSKNLKVLDTEFLVVALLQYKLLYKPYLLR